MNDYLKYQYEDGPKAKVFSLEISQDEDWQIRDAIDGQGGYSTLSAEAPGVLHRSPSA